MKNSHKKLCTLIISLLMLSTLLMGCDGPTQTPGGTTDPPTITTPTEDNRPVVDNQTGSFVQRADELDYSYMWWPEGYTGNLRELYAMTGRYGLALNESTGFISRFGAFESTMDQTAAMSADNSLISTLPSFSMKYAINYGGKDYTFNTVEKLDGKNTIRQLETGRFLQRMDFLGLRCRDNKALCGRLEVTLLPEYFALNYEVFPESLRIDDAVLTLSLALDATYTQTQWSQNNHALTVSNAGGAGYTLVLPATSGASMEIKDNFIVISCPVERLARNKFTGFGVMVIPSNNASTADADLYLARDGVTATATQISPNQREQTVTYDASHGMISIDMQNAFSLAEGDLTDDDLDTYEKVRFTLTNTTDKTVFVPVQFIKNRPLSVTGPSPMLLDPETGEPTGHSIQITRNWHSYDGSVATSSPLRSWEGYWYHCYTLIEVPAGQSVTYDFCVSYARWGGVESVVHSQLCLAGWGGLQQWETCSLGAYGESFCYDVARTYTHCTMGDICAFGLYSRVDGGKYNWTTNTGGVDFIGAKDLLEYDYKVSSMKTFFKNHGPNLSEVVYTGILGGKVKFDIKASTPRTNDISMANQTFTYTFLEDFKFSRLWFYQFGADTYNYDYWDRMVVGNNDGTVDFTLNGKTYRGEFATPAVDSYPDYLGHGGMNQVDVPGEGAWFAFLGADAGQSKGNKAISIKEYKAELNGKVYTQPTFSIRTTGVYVSSDMFWEGASIELNPPAEVGKVIKAGSTISFTVQYYNLPAHKSDYYGQGEALLDMPAADYDTWKLPYMYAVRNNLSLSATVGTVERIYTPLIRSTGETSGVVAEFELRGGIGYVPITISGVKGYSGWRLEQKVDRQWQTVDQSVHGNDYWQTWYDTDGTFELTFNVPASGDNFVGQYRLIKAAQ